MKAVNLTEKAQQSSQLISRLNPDFRHCYQCGKCTAGCPVAFTMDVAPNQIIRMLQLGLIQEALNSETIWLCASCSTCSTRCPKNVDLARVMDRLRMIALQQGIGPRGRGKKVALFNQLFLDALKKHGRSYEVGLMLKYNLKRFNPFKDAFVGSGMFSRGKLKFGPHKIKGASDMLRIIENVQKLEAK